MFAQHTEPQERVRPFFANTFLWLLQPDSPFLSRCFASRASTESLNVILLFERSADASAKLNLLSILYHHNSKICAGWESCSIHFTSKKVPVNFMGLLFWTGASGIALVETLIQFNFLYSLELGASIFSWGNNRTHLNFTPVVFAYCVLTFLSCWQGLADTEKVNILTTFYYNCYSDESQRELTL